MTFPHIHSASWRTEVARVLIVPCLLVAVVGLHLHDRVALDLSPWKGGGFAMFSTVDAPSERILRLELHTSEGSFVVHPPSLLSDHAQAATTTPSTQRLSDLGRRALTERWIVTRLTRPEERLDDGQPSAELHEELAFEALANLFPDEAVTTVEDDMFDPDVHHPLHLQGVTVTVYRLVPISQTVFEPVSIRSVLVGWRSGS